MRPPGVLLTASILLFGGCVAPGGDDTPDGGSDATILPWGFTDCDFAVAFVPIPAANLEGRLPEGFRPLSFTELGLPPDPRGEANIGTELWSCAEGAGLHGTIQDVVYSAYFTAVEPPEGSGNESNFLHFVKWEVLVPDDDMRAALVARGVPAVDGEGGFSSFTMNGDQAAFDGSFTMNGSFALRAATVAPADAALRDFTFTEFMPTPHGLAMWNTTVHAPAASAGGGTLALSGAMAEIVGATSVQAYFLAGRGEFVDATVWLPPTG